MTKSIYIILFILLNFFVTIAQYPQYFVYDNENGLPSNEVYSIAQDQKGFIWIGCDAGLFKFDGINYIAYKCKTQNSKSIYNLSISKSGIIYCANFQNQIFCIKNDTLSELHHPFVKILNIYTDTTSDNVYVNHSNGISLLNSKTQRWQSAGNIQGFTRCMSLANSRDLFSLCTNGVVKISNGASSVLKIPGYDKDIVKDFLSVNYKHSICIFKRDGGASFVIENNKIKKHESHNLESALKNKKITHLKSLSDGNLWICTYSGIIAYNYENDEAVIMYPESSFSDVIIDREGSYWFTTIQKGIIRVPRLSFLVWDKQSNLTGICNSNSHIYYSAINGSVGALDVNTNETEVFHTGINADIQSLDYDSTLQVVWLNLNNRLFALRKNTFHENNNVVHATKSYKHIGDDFFAASSQGLFINGKQINSIWCRAVEYDKKQNTVWVASNKGLLKFNLFGNEWKQTDLLFKNTQILSITFKPDREQLFSLSFNGQIYEAETKLTTLPDETQANKLKYSNNKLFVATNKGVWIYNLIKKEWKHLNTLSGLTSENVKDLTILNNTLWIATGKGLQKIPLAELNTKSVLAKIYLKNQSKFPLTDFLLNYTESLFLTPEASIYNANGKFEYAYRVNKNDWIKLPATVNHIEIQNLPTGAVEIELKVIDHQGQNSENTIVLNGFVKPPFWLTWWFWCLSMLLFIVLVFFIFNRQWKKRQQKMQLENEMNVLKLTAIKSQMNPHFIFNVLSSIKGYIYDNDRKKATAYLDDFSDFIRTVLEKSEVQYESLADEINTIKLYIELEAMMLDNFFYDITIAENINTNAIKIPSLLLQPYVENAFIHGLRHKQGDKKLLLNFFVDHKQQLVIEITDNGIGRKQAEELNRNNSLKRKSFATKAMQKRIEIINKQSENKILVETIDLYDENYKSSGTKVIFIIK